MSGPTSLKTALFSDVHGNTPALRAVLADIQAEGCERIFILGDIVNGLDPQGSIDLLRAAGVDICVQGNAEAYLLTPRLDALPEQDDPKNRAVIALIEWIRTRLDAPSLEWIASWPSWAETDGMFLAHDHPFDRLFPQRWARPGLAAEHQEWMFHSAGIRPNPSAAECAELQAWMETRGVQSTWVGHTHEAFVFPLGARLLCNTGSAGMPLDGDPLPSWVLFQDGHAEIRRASYAFEEILALADANPDYPMFDGPGYRAAYLKWLRTGLHWRMHLPAS